MNQPDAAHHAAFKEAARTLIKTLLPDDARALTTLDDALTGPTTVRALAQLVCAFPELISQDSYDSSGALKLIWQSPLAALTSGRELSRNAQGSTHEFLKRQGVPDAVWARRDDYIFVAGIRHQADELFLRVDATGEVAAVFFKHGQQDELARNLAQLLLDYVEDVQSFRRTHRIYAELERVFSSSPQPALYMVYAIAPCTLSMLPPAGLCTLEDAVELALKIPDARFGVTYAHGNKIVHEYTCPPRELAHRHAAFNRTTSHVRFWLISSSEHQLCWLSELSLAAFKTGGPAHAFICSAQPRVMFITTALSVREHPPRSAEVFDASMTVQDIKQRMRAFILTTQAKLFELSARGWESKELKQRALLRRALDVATYLRERPSQEVHLTVSGDLTDQTWSQARLIWEG